MSERKIRDQLRREYFDLLPDILRVAWQLEAEIRYLTLPILHELREYEQLVVKSRIKECESAIATLRRKQEGNTFDPDRLEEYSLGSLKDLAGVRALVFPCKRLLQVDELLRGSKSFKSWTSDPVTYARGFAQAPKYFGFCDPQKVSSKVQGEYQVVPMLIGRFWDVEHSAMYKPSGWAKGADNDHDLKTLRTKVECSLARFEEEFERFVTRNSLPPTA